MDEWGVDGHLLYYRGCELGCEGDPVIEHETVPAPVRPPALLEVPQDAPLQLVHVLEAFYN